MLFTAHISKKSQCRPNLSAAQHSEQRKIGDAGVLTTVGQADHHDHQHALRNERREKMLGPVIACIEYRGPI
jgi:hypothetical protein